MVTDVEFLGPYAITSSQSKTGLDKSGVMALMGSPAKSQMGLFLEYPFPRILVSIVAAISKKTWRTHEERLQNVGMQYHGVSRGMPLRWRLLNFFLSSL